MRVADVDRDDRQPLAGDVDLLVGRRRRVCAQLLPDDPVAPVVRRADDAAPRVDLDVGRPGFAQEPGSGDPRAVPRQLGRRPVRVPDPNGRRGSPSRAGDLEHAVGADPEADVAQALDARRGERGLASRAARRGGTRCRARATSRTASPEATPRRARGRPRPRPPDRGPRRRGRCPVSAASTCAGTRRTGACGRRSARAPRRGSSSAISRSPRVFSAVRETCPSSAARTSSTTPRANISSARARIRRSSSSLGTSRPKIGRRTAGRAAPEPVLVRRQRPAARPRARGRVRDAGGRSGARPRQ